MGLMVMPSLLLQKTSEKAKIKDNIAALRRKLEYWRNGQLNELLSEGREIQRRLSKRMANKARNGNHGKSIRFAKLMRTGKINPALRLLDNSGGGIIPITGQTMKLLREKHPKGKKHRQTVYSMALKLKKRTLLCLNQ